jgi:pyruvate,water dikinase
VVLSILKGLVLAKPRTQSSRPAWQVARDELLTRPLLRFPPLRTLFLNLLAEGRCLLQIREDTHFYATLALPVIRRTLLEFGRRLVSDGVLSSPENVFHLKLGELEQVDGTWPPPPHLADELRTVALRRKQRRAALEGTPLIDPRLFRRTELEGSVLHGDVLLRGTPGSPGVAEGPVRIIRDGSEFGKLRSGEVLVAPYTNPAWTPLFQRAAAVVVDGGGAASHAAIVAREYGIPAVMGTVEGTRKLTDGQRVMVDGDQGRVTLLSKDEA